MVALLRAVQYEKKERTWGKDGFKSSIIDVGFSLYECRAGTDLCCNFSCGKFNQTKFVNNVTACVFPPIPLLKVAARLDEEDANTWLDTANNSPSKVVNPLSFRRIGVFLFSIFFYAGWILILVDHVKSEEDPTKWGSIQGNATNPSGNKEYYMSTRTGYYREWGNKGTMENGDVIQYNLALQGNQRKD